MRGGAPDTYTCVRVATAGPAKPVTHAALRHQHQLGTPTPTPNGVPARIVRNTILRPSLRPSLPPSPPTSILTSAFLFSAPCPFFSSPPRSLSCPPLLLRASPLLAPTRRGYARSSNRAYCRGYTPIDPEVPSNGQLENRLGFPRSHPTATSRRPLAPAKRARAPPRWIIARL